MGMKWEEVCTIHDMHSHIFMYCKRGGEGRGGEERVRRGRRRGEGRREEGRGVEGERRGEGSTGKAGDG